MATGVSYAGTTADKVMPWLDRQAEAWKRARTDACKNADIRGVWDRDILDRSVWCLEDRQMDVGSLVAEFGRANEVTVQKAVSAVASLRASDACLDESLLRRQPSPPALGLEAIRSVRVELSQAQSLRLAGNIKDALKVASQARERAEVLGWPPLLAAARAQEGKLLGKAGAYAEAEAVSVKAYFEAAHSGTWEVAASAATNLVYIVGFSRARPAGGHEWAQHAAVAMSYAGDPVDTWEAARLSSLASVQWAAGAYAEARTLNERALVLYEKALGPDHPDVAETMGQLAQLLRGRGQLAEAETLISKALAIRESKLGLRHPQVAESCSDMGDLQMQKGDLQKAESFYNRSLDVRKQTFGAEHPAVAQSLFKQASVLRARGELARALPLYQQSLQLREKLLGPAHPEVAESLVGVAAAQIGAGKTDAALPLLSRAVEIDELVLRSIGGSSNEARVDAFLRTLRTQEDIIYSLVTESPSEVAVSLIATTALLRKGRSVDEAADTSRALYQGLKEEERQKLAALREVRTRRADLALAGAGVYPPDVYQKLLRDLQDSEEQQQAELVKSSQALRSKLQSARPKDVVASVQKALPEGAVLLEVVAFGRFNFKPTAQKPAIGAAPLHYAAITLGSDGKPMAFDLGDGVPIDNTVGNLLSALTNPEADWEEPAKALKQLVLAPAREGLGKSSKWFLSMDGQLSLVPFSVLPLADGKLTLVDKIELVYVTSGRDLLRRSDGEGAKTSVAMLADPQFSLTGKRAAAAADSGAAQSRASGIYRGLRLGKVAPLPGTRQEAKAIEKLLKKSELTTLLGDHATKQEFLKIEQPGILHAATHGLFLGDTNKPGDNSRGVVIDEDESRPAPSTATAAAGAARPVFIENPLLSSMLVMAGAETASKTPAEARDPEIGNGLVTALEVASMNLWGTQLVVLSACETGRGDVSNLGQGVYGLRRAVMVAGAQTLLTSLWKVDDKATRDLMTRYYKNLLGGSGRAEAMRAAAQYVRKKRPHPYYWAPFITIGRSAPLSGIGKASAAASEGKDEDEDEEDKKSK